MRSSEEQKKTQLAPIRINKTIESDFLCCRIWRLKVECFSFACMKQIEIERQREGRGEERKNARALTKLLQAINLNRRYERIEAERG